MSHQPDTAAWQAALRQEAAGFARLAQLLDEEAALLAASALEPLRVLSADKERLVQELAALAAAREARLADPGVNPRRLDPAAWIAAQPGAARAALAPLWQALVDAASRARTRNEANGHLIDASLQARRQAMDVLTRLAGGATPVYGADGHVAGPSGGRFSTRG